MKRRPLIIEGIEGAGKTTLACALSRALGWPVYRALRSDTRLADDQLSRWRDMGVPANSYVEDIFAADLLFKLYSSGQHSGVILDRSMVSGLIYDEKLDSASKSVLLGEWAARMKLANAVFVLLTTDPRVALERRAGDARFTDERQAIITLVERQQLMRHMAIQAGLRFHEINTTNMTVEQVQEKVVGCLS